ncbi:MAG TPA: CBS domain-containing protein, partial [Nitrososphaeraceae archaeon]
VSDIEEEPREFQKEFKIAVVGPLTSFGLAGVFSLFSFIIENVSANGTAITMQAIDVVLYYGALANIMLGAFNLIPAFPLDGGRILRATLLKRKRDYDAATRSVIRISILISYALMGFGFLGIISRSFVGGLWVLIIGWFLNAGAHSYMQQRELGSLLSSVTLKQVMNTNMIVVKKGTNLYDVFKKYFELYMKSGFPVTDDSGCVIGLITLTIAKAVPEQEWMYTAVDDVMVPRNNLIVMDPNTNADQALNKMAIQKMNIVFIKNGEGGIAGLVSKTDILNIAAERKKYFDALRQE